jgi:hypothetical protein
MTQRSFDFVWCFVLFKIIFIHYFNQFI